MRLPLPPDPGELEFQAEQLGVVSVETVLWRVHRTNGGHVVPWNELRHWRGSPYLTVWSPARDLALLDLTGSWPIQAGASYAINTGRRDHCRAWARTIHTARPDLDGLWHHSSMTGGDAVTLFTHAADSFPDRPRLSLPLDHPGLRGHVLAAATQIAYRVV